MRFGVETKELADYAREVLRLDERTGELFWRKSWARRRSGERAGNVGTNGHARVGLMGRYVQAHRVVWLLSTGEWPTGFVDHINGCPTDNQMANLRIATKSENAQNSGTRSDNRTGFRGVGWSAARKKFRARICVDGKRRIVGYFDDPKDAARAYAAAQKTAHPFHPGARATL